jgi:hypothetical protein
MPKTSTLETSPVLEDPVLFTETYLHNRDGSPAKPHPAQVDMMRGVKPLTVCCCGRQLGKSVWLGWYGTWFAVTHANREVYIIAPTVDQSRIIFNEIAFHFRTSIFKDLVVGKIKEYPFPMIQLANGTRIHGRGANNPQFIRGKPIHLALLDEAAFFKDGVLKNTIEPMFTVTGQQKHSGMICISTPFGLGDFHDFAVRAQKGEEDTAWFQYTSLDNPHANMKYLWRIRDEYGEDSLLWRTEYLAQFVDDDLAVFPWSQIKAAVERFPYERFPVAPNGSHRYVQGTDLANVRDYFVTSLLDITDPQLVPLVHYDRLQKKGYKRYKEIIRQNYRAYNHPKTLIDATSLGESVVEDLDDIQAEGYKFSTASKYEVVQDLSRMFAEGRIALPNDRTIIDELRYFQYFITPSKQLKMEAKRGHDDIVMSLALAARLALIPRKLGFFQPVTGFDPKKRRAVELDRLKKINLDPFAALFIDEEE